MPEGSLADCAGRLLTAPDRALVHLLSLQRADGSWEGEVVWCTMILSQYVIVQRATARTIDDRARQDIVRHYAATRTAEGAWALHAEGPPQIFTTTLAYVALRLLGVEPDDELVAPAREWLRRQPGGVLGIPTWGKFWLSLLDLYRVDGISALPPQLFILPRWMPFHPLRWYCHTRYIYLAMAYLFGRRFTASLGPLRDALRAELYAEPYDTIDFSAHREHVSPGDLYARPGAAVRFLRRALSGLDAATPGTIRDRALRSCLERIGYEQRVTRFQGLSPVNGLLNCLALFAADPSHADLARSLGGLEAWAWRDSVGGLRYAGARSQVWDTAFAIRAAVAHVRRVNDTGLSAPPDLIAQVRRAHAYLVGAQMTEELPNGFVQARQFIRGGWCFSDGRHRWPVSDCTAEALTAIVELEQMPGVIPEASRLPKPRIAEALAFILARQNDDGGFSTYERIRAPAWVDRLNPSEMFRDCMTEHSYVECTASAIEALATIRSVCPEILSTETRHALTSALAYIRRSQRPDGAYPSAWGICFTYSIFHVVKAMRAAGVDASDPAIARAAQWLLTHQREDGGWGEHFSTCLGGEYVPHPRPQAVMTSWALLALADAAPSSNAVDRGLTLLASLQRADGSWGPDAVNGVFFGTAMLDYRLYHAYFPVWALARWQSRDA